MEFTHEIYFDPTPKLKSSPVQIFFLPFNNEKLNCYNCGDKYSDTLSYKQKYCKQCLLRYIKSRVDNNEYFDVNIITNNTPCNKHESTRDINFTTRNIQEWCEVCSEISYFKNYYVQINTKIQHIFMEKDCKLCGKSIDEISYGFKMCSNCYLIHSGWIKSIFDTTVPILCLPWWDASNKSKACNHNLKFLTDCQKWCSSCFIVYVGCRHCLTTNIIFGITNQTKCRKCKRVSDICIDFIDMCGGNSIIAEYLISMKTNNQSYNKIACYMNKEWIPYSKIDNLEIIAEGGLGTIYKATCSNNFVAVKRFSNSKDISRHFLNEINSLHRCYNTAFIVKYYGITQDPDSQIKDYIYFVSNFRRT
ncbi:unnamed protein product [Rhizophagus irregularis]|nr:unnamed protein product [Rhizophagus irregularis]